MEIGILQVKVFHKQIRRLTDPIAASHTETHDQYAWEIYYFLFL